MIDTHSHLLPFVDHGSADMHTSVIMAREAARSGITTIVCTPHLAELVQGDVTRAHQVIEQVRNVLLEQDIAINLLLGFEVDLEVAAGSSKEELARLTIEGSRGAMVLEMPYEGWPRFMEETVFRLATWGFRPVLAHPERNDRIQKSPELLTGCLKAGAVAQATAASLTGEFGRAPGRTLTKLLSQGLIQLLASDAHSYRTDDWTLTTVIERLRDKVSEQNLKVLVEDNPRRLLEGMALCKVKPGDTDHSWSRQAVIIYQRGRRRHPYKRIP